MRRCRNFENCDPSIANAAPGDHFHHGQHQCVSVSIPMRKPPLESHAQENRTHGSEAGEGATLPNPYRAYLPLCQPIL